jgi:hypothetical protein
MSHEFAMEFKEERFENDVAGERVLSEFLSELFDELGFPSMRIHVYYNPKKQTKVFKARWED